MGIKWHDKHRQFQIKLHADFTMLYKTCKIDDPGGQGLTMFNFAKLVTFVKCNFFLISFRQT